MTDDGTKSPVKAYLLIVAAVLVVPAPPALFFGGTNWLTRGSHGGLQEFVIAYVLGVIIFIGSILIYLARDRWSRRQDGRRRG